MNDNREADHITKRRKLDKETSKLTPTSADDLHHLLRCQSSPSGVKSALHQFKEFLNAITRSADNDERAKKLQILRTYSEEQLASDHRAPAFTDLISIWSSAVDTNDESLLSSVPSVLSLYLKTISGHLQFRDFGLALCRSLLLKDQLRLLDRGLTATKTKEHLISPCLRLLTEVVGFDAGELASLVYSKRDTTLRRLDIFLNQRKPSADGPGDAEQKPILRCVAQRYLLANLKYQSTSAIGDIIAHGRILRCCLQGMKNDRADIVREILLSLENDIVRAKSLAKGVKSRLFTHWNLASLASLYIFREPANEVSPGRTVREHVDSLLRLICTKPDSGVLVPQNGWYPAGCNPEKSFSLAPGQDMILPGIGLFSNFDYRDKFPVKNLVLSSFIQDLRPETDKLQASLLLDIFRSAPELVADYFSKKSNSVSEPQDTPVWLGQSAFLFSVIQLPVPAYCGWNTCYAPLPPPSSAVIESVLPRPLDRRNITRSLNLNHEVITLFAVRAVTVAFQKLSKVLEVYHAAPINAESWREVSSDLLSTFSQRCPLAKDVLSTWQRTPKSDQQLRASITELLANYYQVLPHLILREKFDISLALIDAIEWIGNDTEDQPLKSSRFSGLEHLLTIAETSPDTKWWQKPDCLQHSVFTSMLTAVLGVDQSITAIPSIRQLLRRIAVEHGILPDRLDCFDALANSLTPERNWKPSTKTISFFDNCAGRIARQPVHYEDLAAEKNVGNAVFCLLPICIVEQWTFAIKNEDLDGQMEIALWISRLFAHLASTAGDKDLIQELHSQIVDATADAALKREISKAYQEIAERKDAKSYPTALGPADNGSNPLPVSDAPDTLIAREAIIEPKMQDMEWTEGLERLVHENLEEVVADGRLSRVCRSLSSPAEETRRQGFVTLQGTMKQIEFSSYTEKGPLFVLIGELAETAKSVGLANRLSAVCTEFAAEAVDILNQPSHLMYGKINKFLQKGPSWNVSHFVGYWIEKVLFQQPEDDHGDLHETTWLLGLLMRGLRDGADMELYRRSNVFDRVLALYQSTVCPGKQRKQILELVNRSIEVGGGMTLITRIGMESWIAVEEADGKALEVIKRLRDQLLHSTAAAVVNQWKVPADPAPEAT